MTASGALRRLARSCGVEVAYSDWKGERREASAGALLATLRALGVAIDRPEDAAAVLAERERRRRDRLLEPVGVAWGGRAADLTVRAERGGGRALECEIRTEDGDRRAWRVRTRDLAPGRDGTLRLGVPGGLPVGRHRLTVRSSGAAAECVILAAPARLAARARELGAFLPLYALRSRRNLGLGDLTDLGALASWSRSVGAPTLGTLPLLTSFLDEPFEPSPYSPVSRLFWNELYVDPLAAPEFAGSEAARRMVASAEFRREAAALRRARLVDYRRIAALKRRLLGELARAAFSHEETRRRLERFARERDGLRDYARFMAVVSTRREPWQSWPGRLRRGSLRSGDYREDDRRYHVYAQWLLDRQLSAASGLEGGAGEGDAGGGLYLDLPVGVNGAGFDVWRHREAFATGASVGAPPDALFAGGQNWGFPPPHPERGRKDGHAYFAACVRNHLRYARTLRVDHVMGLYRLFWIPEGMGGGDGVYVRYPEQELFAAMLIEAQRAHGGEGARVVGENLGTVPPEVDRLMRERGVLGMAVGQFMLRPDARAPLPRVASGTLASLNTHDTPTFAGFLGGHDIGLRVRLGILGRREAAVERRDRRALRAALVRYARRRGEAGSVPGVLRALLTRMSASEAEVLLVNLEDLWLETRPQNVPGVSAGYPAWRVKAARGLEEIVRDTGIVEWLRELAKVRAPSPSGRGAAQRR